jgi:hypothetical protein
MGEKKKYLEYIYNNENDTVMTFDGGDSYCQLFNASKMSTNERENLRHLIADANRGADGEG